MDLSSQRQYIQRAENIHINIALADTFYTVYTSPGGGSDYDFSVIHSILVCEHDGQLSQFSATNTDGVDTFNLFSAVSIAAHTTTELLSRPIIIHHGEIIKVKSNKANNLDIHMSIVEYGKGD